MNSFAVFLGCAHYLINYDRFVNSCSGGLMRILVLCVCVFCGTASNWLYSFFMVYKLAEAHFIMKVVKIVY